MWYSATREGEKNQDRGKHNPKRKLCAQLRHLCKIKGSLGSRFERQVLKLLPAPLTVQLNCITSGLSPKQETNVCWEGVRGKELTCFTEKETPRVEKARSLRVCMHVCLQLGKKRKKGRQESEWKGEISVKYFLNSSKFSLYKMHKG